MESEGNGMEWKRKEWKRKELKRMERKGEMISWSLEEQGT